MMRFLRMLIENGGRLPIEDSERRLAEAEFQARENAAALERSLGRLAAVSEELSAIQPEHGPRAWEARQARA